MDRHLIAILASGVVVVGLTVGLVLWPSTPVEVPEGQRHYMHCPKCEHEMRYDRKRFAKEECPYCGEKGPLAATAESIRKTGLPSSPVSRLIPALLVEFIVLASVFYLYASKRLQRGPGEEPTYPLYCRHCHRKLRFRKSQGGRLGQCPICRRPIVFPKVPESRKLPWHVRIWQTITGRTMVPAPLRNLKKP